MDIREVTRYFHRLFSLWRRVSEAYAKNNAESAIRLSNQIDRLQLDNWRRAPDKANAR